MNFNEWWSKYCEGSSLNEKFLSFLDADIFREEMKLAYYHRLPGDASDTPMSCGHPKSAVVSADEGTQYCGVCEDEAK